MILAENHSTQYKIIIAADAAVQHIHAAEELRTFLYQITGAAFQIYTEKETILEVRPSKHLNGLFTPEFPTYIYVGDTEFCTRMGYTVPQDLGKEGYSIHTMDCKLYITGGYLRGVLYGVYSFLEIYCGCRWFTEEVSRIPKRNRLEIPEIDDTKLPVLEYREPHYTSYGDADWHIRNRCNSTTSVLSEMYGGKITYKGFVHTFNDILHPKDYFAQHPEYFSEVNGVRKDGNTQLCLSNPEVLELTKKKVRTWLKEDPNAAIISVSQNDWGNYCTCEKCRSLDEKEGSHMGSLLTFVNAIADDIKDDYPDVAIDTLAYQYTRKAPKHVRPRPNVIIRLCTIECCFSHPLEECDHRFVHYDGCDQTFRQDLEEWGKICSRLYIWDYVVNFHHNLLPHPNWGVLQKNIQFFIRNNVKGVFEQGNSFRGKYGEFDLMKRYVLAKLMWNPDCDMDVVVNEYLNGVYGMAAGEVRRYYDLLQGLIDPDTHLWIFHNPDDSYLTDTFLKDGDACLARAEIVAEDDEILQRVRVLRLSTRYALLCRMAADDPGREAGWDAFYRDVTAAGIETFYWRQMPEQAMEYLRAGDLKFGSK